MTSDRILEAVLGLVVMLLVVMVVVLAMIAFAFVLIDMGLDAAASLLE